MRAGSLDRRVSIQRRANPYDDGVTTRPGDWAELTTRKCRVIRSRAREVFENLGKEAEIPVTFLMRSDSVTRTIVSTDRIVFEGRNYDLKSIQEIGRREGIEIVGVANDED